MDNNFIKTTIKIVLNENLNDKKIIAYHGTNTDFKSFYDNKPIFFVDDLDVAKTYGYIIFKVELTIQNPIIFDFDGSSTFFFLNKWYLPSDLANRIKKISNDIENHYQLDDELKNELEYHDYNLLFGNLDGIVMKNISDAGTGFFATHNPATNYVVFNKNQIKILKKIF